MQQTVTLDRVTCGAPLGRHFGDQLNHDEDVQAAMENAAKVNTNERYLPQESLEARAIRRFRPIDQWHLAVRPCRAVCGGKTLKTPAATFPGGDCGFQVAPGTSTMPAEDEEYRGYRIAIGRHGSGWRATIYAPDSRQPILGPQSDDPASRDDVLDRAKSFIDALRGS